MTQGNSLSKLPFSESGSLDNERLDVQKLNTNDTDFSKTNKDIKDNKDWKEQNDLLISGIDKINQDIVTNSVPSLFSRGGEFFYYLKSFIQSTIGTGSNSCFSLKRNSIIAIRLPFLAFIFLIFKGSKNSDNSFLIGLSTCLSMSLIW